MGNEQGSAINNYKALHINTNKETTNDHRYPSQHIAKMSHEEFDEILDEVNNEIAHHYDQHDDETLQLSPTTHDNTININSFSNIDQDNISNDPSISSFISSPENIVPNINTIFEYISQLGKGASCRVFKARHLKNNKLYAVKELTKSNDINETLFQKEVELLRKLLHPNILHYHDCYMDDNNYYITTEYCSGK